MIEVAMERCCKARIKERGHPFYRLQIKLGSVYGDHRTRFANNRYASNAVTGFSVTTSARALKVVRDLAV